MRSVTGKAEKARAWAGALTASLHGVANLTSAKLAAKMAPFEAFQKNKADMLKVI